jgi:hypothetical protein
VVADDAQGLPQFVGEFTGAGLAFSKALEDPGPKWVREGFGNPDLCGFTQCLMDASTG